MEYTPDKILSFGSLAQPSADRGCRYRSAGDALARVEEQRERRAATMRTTKRQWCFRNPCLATRSRPRGRSVAPVEMTAADISNADGGGGHHVQEKRSLPSRSPSRKLTPYPGKTGASSLKNLQRLMAPGSQVMSAGDRQTSLTGPTRRSTA